MFVYTHPYFGSLHAVTPQRTAKRKKSNTFCMELAAKALFDPILRPTSFSFILFRPDSFSFAHHRVAFTALLRPLCLCAFVATLSMYVCLFATLCFCAALYPLSLPLSIGCRRALYA